MVKRIFVIAILFLLLPLYIERAGAETATSETVATQSDGRIMIRYLTFETNAGQQQLLRALVTEFEKRNPDIKVRVEPNSDAEKIFVTDAAAGIPPDVVYIGKEHLPKLVDNNVLEPLDPYLKRDNVNLDLYFPTVVNHLRYPSEKGNLYAFPIHFSTDALFYNEEIFDKAGLPYPDETWDWKKYEEVGLKLTSQPDEHGVKQVFGNLTIEQQILMGSYDVKCFDEKTNRLTVDTTTAVEALRWNSELIGRSAPHPSEVTDSDDMRLFCNNRLAMFVGRTWQLPEIDRRINGKIRWNITHIPKSSVKRFSLLGIGGNCISHLSKNKEAAWRFVKFYSSEDGLAYISRGRKNCVPAIKSMAMSPDFFMSPPPTNVGVFVDAIQYADVYVPCMDWTFEFGKTIWLSYINRVKAGLPGWTPESCMSRIQNDGNALIEKRKAIKDRRQHSEFSKVDIAQDGASTNFIMYGLLGVMALVFASIAGICRSDKRKWEGYAFISPWIIGFCAFTLGPVVMSLYLSFCDYNVFTPPLWVGLDNFMEIFHDPRYLKSLTNTIYYTIFVVPLSIICALALAMLVNTKLPGAYTFRAIFYMPALTSGVAIALLWRWIFNPRLGLFNTMLGWVGISGPGWLGSPHWALEAIIIMSVWGGLGGMMIIFLAGLQGIPTHLYEAADIDGASPWQKFWHVTRPMLSPTIFFNLIMSIIGSFQVFATVFVMTQSSGIDNEPGGPAGSTLVYVLHLYQTGFQYLYMGQACAMAWVLFLIILGLTAVNAWFSKRWVHYDQS